MMSSYAKRPSKYKNLTAEEWDLKNSFSFDDNHGFSDLTEFTYIFIVTAKLNTTAVGIDKVISQTKCCPSPDSISILCLISSTDSLEPD